jgi:membrane protein involved in colicin uptake
VNFTLNIKKMESYSSTKAAAEAQAAELKATAVLEANEAAQAAAEAQAATQDALEMEVFEDAPADLDTPVAGEEIENGAEVPQNEGPDETGNELQPGDEITDPDPVEIPEEEMQVY